MIFVPRMTALTSSSSGAAAGEVERGITAFAGSANSGLVIADGILTAIHRNLIIALAAWHRLPAVYSGRYFVEGGGLLSYGTDFGDHFHRAAGYVDRILRGEKPADLPVQAPTKYEIVINLKVAKALGLDVPSSLLARAAEKRDELAPPHVHLPLRVGPPHAKTSAEGAAGS
jgi:ABC-type uncharacterized transport system substrate-binding protein